MPSMGCNNAEGQGQLWDMATAVHHNVRHQPVVDRIYSARPRIDAAKFKKLSPRDNFGHDVSDYTDVD
jgi:hypothetical protein